MYVAEDAFPPPPLRLHFSLSLPLRLGIKVSFAHSVILFKCRSDKSSLPDWKLEQRIPPCKVQFILHFPRINCETQSILGFTYGAKEFDSRADREMREKQQRANLANLKPPRSLGSSSLALGHAPGGWYNNKLLGCFVLISYQNHTLIH